MAHSFYSMKIVDGDQWSQVISEKTREQNLDIFMKLPMRSLSRTPKELFTET